MPDTAKRHSPRNNSALAHAGAGLRPRLGRYEMLAAVPGAPRLIALTFGARLPLAMVALAILQLVRAHGGSYGEAGAAVAAETLAMAVATPIQGRLVDRLGIASVVTPLGAAQASAFLAMLLVMRAGVRIEVTVFLAALIGASMPPITACARSLWSSLGDPQVVEIAMAVEGVAQELLSVLGPLIVALAILVGGPEAAIVATAALTAVGALVFVLDSRVRAFRPSGRAAGTGSASDPLFTRVLSTLLAANAFTGVAIGLSMVALPALGIAVGQSWTPGLLIAVWSIGSIVAVLAYGAREWGIPLRHRYARLLAITAVAALPLAFAGTLSASLFLSFLAGVGYGPAMACQGALLASLASKARLTETFTWSATSLIAGITVGSALGGVLVEGAGAGFTLGIAAVAVAVAAVCAVFVPADGR